MQNYDEESRCFYGIISADSLDFEIVDTLMFGVQATNISYLANLRQECIDRGAVPVPMTDDERAMGKCEVFDHPSYPDEDFMLEDMANALEITDVEAGDEPTIEGTYEDIEYCTSWLGGALNFFITESPCKVTAPQCSPCVPNAGNLDNYYRDHNLGNTYCHGVHPWWLRRGL